MNLLNKLSCVLVVGIATALPDPARAQATSGGGTPQTAQTRMPGGQYDLGVVTDIRRVNVEGVTILAVTPGGAADRMALLAGDRLVAVNGRRLDDTLTPTAALQQALASKGGAVRIELVRNGRPMTLEGRADSIAAGGDGTATGPGSCGYVTASGPTPTLSEKIFGVEITRIDGNSTPLFPVHRHRVDAGRHALIVRETIDNRWLNSAQKIQRQRLLKREYARAYKAIIIDVKPGTKHYVGARLLVDKLDTESIHNNQYWEPVVWKEIQESCR